MLWRRAVWTVSGAAVLTWPRDSHRGPWTEFARAASPLTSVHGGVSSLDADQFRRLPNVSRCGRHWFGWFGLVWFSFQVRLVWFGLVWCLVWFRLASMSEWQFGWLDLVWSCGWANSSVVLIRLRWAPGQSASAPCSRNRFSAMVISMGSCLLFYCLWFVYSQPCCVSA